jgi:hypothetical protein
LNFQRGAHLSSSRSLSSSLLSVAHSEHGTVAAQRLSPSAPTRRCPLRHYTGISEATHSSSSPGSFLFPLPRGAVPRLSPAAPCRPADWCRSAATSAQRVGRPRAAALKASASAVPPLPKHTAAGRSRAGVVASTGRTQNRCGHRRSAPPLLHSAW